MDPGKGGLERLGNPEPYTPQLRPNETPSLKPINPAHKPSIGELDNLPEGGMLAVRSMTAPQPHSLWQSWQTVTMVLQTRPRHPHDVSSNSKGISSDSSNSHDNKLGNT